MGITDSLYQMRRWCLEMWSKWDRMLTGLQSVCHPHEVGHHPRTSRTSHPNRVTWVTHTLQPSVSMAVKVGAWGEQHMGETQLDHMTISRFIPVACPGVASLCVRVTLPPWAPPCLFCVSTGVSWGFLKSIWKLWASRKIGLGPWIRELLANTFELT